MHAQLATAPDKVFAPIDAAPAHLPWGPTASSVAAGHSGPVQHVAADTEIYGEDDETRSYYKIVSGVVRTCKFMCDGRRQIDAFYGPGDVFGFEAGTLHRLAAEAVSDCTLIAYRRRGLETVAANDDRVAQQFFTYALQCLQRAQEHSLLLGRRSAAGKLAAFLLETADRGRGGEHIDLAMSRQDIADYLGLTIETVSRTLSQFERDGVIGLPSSRHIWLRNRGALREFNA